MHVLAEFIVQFDNACMQLAVASSLLCCVGLEHGYGEQNLEAAKYRCFRIRYDGGSIRNGIASVVLRKVVIAETFNESVGLLTVQLSKIALEREGDALCAVSTQVPKLPSSTKKRRSGVLVRPRAFVIAIFPYLG
jgi:hypothetical protein